MHNSPMGEYTCQANNSYLFMCVSPTCSSLLSERSSKQTLRKWVAAKKRERTTSSTESHSTAFHSQQVRHNKLPIRYTGV